MSERHLPVRPDLPQLEEQADDLLRSMRIGNPTATLANVRETLARSYGVAGWARLVQACRLIDAIWRDEAGTVRGLVQQDPRLLRENARGTEHCNWGPPMSYAANLGRDRIITLLHKLGATDLGRAMGRAALQGHTGTARMLHGMGALAESGGRPPPGALMGTAETLNGAGMELMFEFGAEVSEARAEAAMVLETYDRNPEGKHRCLELLARHGVKLPDTPPMAVHRGRTDLLEAHLRSDPDMLLRTVSLEAIYPPGLGCHGAVQALHGTPLDGATLLHLCVDYDEMEIARWLLNHGMPVDARAEVDPAGFGGHTALFGCAVSYANFMGRQRDAAFARLLLDRGADPNVRASLRKQLDTGPDRSLREYRDVTPLSWGRQFHDQDFVSQAVLRLIEERGGKP